MSDTDLRPHSSGSANAKRQRRRPPRRGSAAQAGSPEVISSLISSLSAISSPAEEFYDGLFLDLSSKGGPPSPSKSRSRSIRDEVISEDPAQEGGNGNLYLDDEANAPPPIPASRSRPSTSGRGHNRSLRPPSSYSSGGLQGTGSIGAISIEPQQGASISSIHSVTGSRPASVRSLHLKQSRERIRSLDRHSRPASRDPAQTASLHLQTSIEQTKEEDSLEKRLSKAKSVQPAVTHPSPDSPSSPIGNGLLVPVRDSSKRHSYHQSRRQQSRNRSIQEQPVAEAPEDERAENTDQSGSTKQESSNEKTVTKQISEPKSRSTLLLPVSDNPTTRNARNKLSISRVSLDKENLDPATQIKSRSSFSRSFTEPLPGEYTLKKPMRPPSTVADSIDEAIEDYLDNPRLSQRVKDPLTGRLIAFSEVGDPTGNVVFCCVGMGTTRFLTAFYDELATTLKLRLITPDRPGIGDSEPHFDGLGTPLGWPDDIRAICVALNIHRFAVLAHSAGAVYALATALRMPQHIRGRIHLLAPWIPPSQMVAVGIQKDHVPITTLPYSQRLLRSLPASFFKIANSGLFAMTSSSVASAIPSKTKKARRRSTNDLESVRPNLDYKSRRNSRQFLSSSPNDMAEEPGLDDMILASPSHAESVFSRDRERVSDYETRLVHAIWNAALTNANPAVDLLVCLERRQEIGFRYADINKEVVIHHGAKDGRVPVENIKWLGGRMRRCEVRVLEGEGHGLMASAKVMSDVLTEIAQEWENWNTLVGRKHR